MLKETFNPFLSKMAGNKYIWQKASLEGVNLICFFTKNKSNSLPLKKSIQFTIYLMPNFPKNSI